MAGCELGFVGCKVYGPLAQLVEQLTLNQLVVGSIPTRPTNLAIIFSSLRALRQSSKTSAVLFNPHCAIQTAFLVALRYVGLAGLTSSGLVR
jgi:hypothetical protein